TTIPNRPRSYRGAPVAIISMAQHASPKVAGQVLVRRDQFTSFSTLVNRMPLDNFSSMPMSVPLQTTAAPLVDVRHGHRHHEQRHREETSERELIEGHRPRHQEDHLDVEDDEHHRGQVELDRDPPSTHRLRRRLDAALVRLQLGPVVPARPGDPRDDYRYGRESRGEGEEPDDGHIRRQRHGLPSSVLPLRLVMRSITVLPHLLPHTAGATRTIALMIRSMASPPRGSVRCAISLSTNRIRVGCGMPCRTANRITCGWPISFTKIPPSR